MEALESFIIEAKAVTYVSGKVPAPSASRTGAKDISYERGRFRYLDSHFGGTDFLGQEVVWQDEIPVWAMNYYGRILDAERFDGGRAGTVIKQALTALYQEKRFLGGFTYLHPLGEYVDQSVGDYRSFLGVERIRMGECVVYQLDYQGGLIKP
ncbi:XRE family transcriptional regulator [Rhizobium sp. AAP116]|nr:XRE family transcriptional regulator [Rhizobium sp. AAP116]